MSDNKTENVNTSENVSQSSENCGEYSCSDGNCQSDCKQEFQTDFPNGDCPNGVCPLPEKEGKSLKRKMKSPSAVADSDGSSKEPQFDQLFSQLFRSVLQSSNADSDDEESPNKKTNTESKDEEDSDEDEDEEEDEEDQEVDEENENEEEDQEAHRWDVINKLLESHLNITRAVADLLRRD